jgi:hypothetical protein
MSLKTTAKGYNALSVNGVHFSNHSSLIEAVAEKASAILEADPTLVVTVRPPIIEVRASEDAIPVPPMEPIVSDAGEDLIDFLARVSPPPNVIADLGTVSSVEDAADEFADESKTRVLPIRCYATIAGVRTWVGIAWRGYLLLWHRRDKAALRIGGGS